MERNLKREADLWIDYWQAVIVLHAHQAQEIKRIAFKLDKQVFYSAAFQARAASDSLHATDIGQARRFDEQLNRYYDEVISHLRDAASILIVGRGKAKVGLQKRLELHGLIDRSVAINTAERRMDELSVVRQQLRDSWPSSNGISYEQTAQGR